MKIIGLTGSIATGKSTAARMIRRRRLPVHDADAVVHQLMKPRGAAFDLIAEIFPEVIDEDGRINRTVLGRLVYEDPNKKAALEAILHPMVRESGNAFIRKCQRQRRKYCFLDIPLLFETGGENRFHKILCMSAPSYVQRRRAMARSGMTREKLDAIIASQLPQRAKLRMSDYVINSAQGLNKLTRKIGRLFR